ncbi:hypothetical protein MY1_1121 [Nitrosarchaeum koreense MY1]|uniref:Uncharacterized protein n=1 Tax=Nitrosarchaeum koreense MY1 TaxID=1001994 RepID=F9CX79_9ARCH|nr:hypothetical protein MY1_1121 [Nitrosarchaeum koreense MY1]
MNVIQVQKVTKIMTECRIVFHVMDGLMCRNELKSSSRKKRAIHEL